MVRLSGSRAACYHRFTIGAVSAAAVGSRRMPFKENAMGQTASLAAVIGLAALLTAMGPDGAGAQPRTTLDIYVVDVEGGNATLLVPPSGESLLIDTGNVAPEAAVRDAERIMAAAFDARLTQIDTLIITHWH